jgi:hypothetical protein
MHYHYLRCAAENGFHIDVINIRKPGTHEKITEIFLVSSPPYTNILVALKALMGYNNSSNYEQVT